MYQFTKTLQIWHSCLHCQSLKQNNVFWFIENLWFRCRGLIVYEAENSNRMCLCLDVSECTRCVYVLPGKMELRSTGGWLVSTVILNFVALAGEEGTHTNARGRLNLDWRTLGTPEKKKICRNIFIIAFLFCFAFSPMFSTISPFPFCISQQRHWAANARGGCRLPLSRLNVCLQIKN